MLERLLWEDELTIGCGIPLPVLGLTLGISCGTVIPAFESSETLIIDLDPLLCDVCFSRAVEARGTMVFSPVDCPTVFET